MSRCCARRLRSSASPRPARGSSPALFDRIAERLLREVDPLNGGIGTAPKFPQCGIFELLWRGWKRTRQAPYRDAVTRTLTTICQGGIYDHLGGGFARYSVDARWLAPHFEKMLYDNAELVDLLTLVWQETRDPLYAQRVAETIGWLEREMLTSEGGFCLQPRRRQRARGRQILRLDRSRDRRSARRRCRRFSRSSTTSRRRATGRSTRSSTACTVLNWPMPRRRRCWRAVAKNSSPAARRGSGLGSTTRCWPIGTG